MVGMRKWQSQGLWEDYSTFPSAPWTALAEQESAATCSERFKMDFLPLMKVNCHTVKPHEGCLVGPPIGAICGVQLSLESERCPATI